MMPPRESENVNQRNRGVVQLKVCPSAGIADGQRAGADANQPQPRVGAGVRPPDAYVRVLHRMSPEAVRVDETVTGARFVDRPRAEGVDVLHREQPVVILSVRPEAWDVRIVARQGSELRRVREEELHRQPVFSAGSVVNVRVELVLAVSGDG